MDSPLEIQKSRLIFRSYDGESTFLDGVRSASPCYALFSTTIFDKIYVTMAPDAESII